MFAKPRGDEAEQAWRSSRLCSPVGRTVPSHSRRSSGGGGTAASEAYSKLAFGLALAKEQRDASLRAGHLRLE